MPSREQTLAWESRWFVPVGLTTLVAVVLLIGSIFVIGGVGGSGGNAELLREAHDNGSTVTLSTTLEAIGFLLLAAPLYFLFRAASARSQRMLGSLVGLAFLAPLCFGVSAVLNGVTLNDAASTYVAGEAHPDLTVQEATKKCQEKRDELDAKAFDEEYEGTAKGESPQARCVSEKREDDTADQALNEASTSAAAAYSGLAGRLALAIILFYTCLHAMRVGLLTRFWGSLGMALAVAALLLLIQFALIFFVYLGLLLLGRVPGGRPPAWEAGEAIPWPTPGERAAEQLEGEEPLPGEDGDEPDPGSEGGRRKRKRRD